MSFDYNDLSQLRYKQYYCFQCRGILDNSDLAREYSDGSVYCPICNFEYKINSHNRQSLLDCLENMNSVWWSGNDSSNDFNAFISHIVKFDIFRHFIDNRKFIPPIYTLMEYLNIAKNYVHFVTYGNISHAFIGALMLLSRRVQVRGIASNVDDKSFDQMKEFMSESSNLIIHMHKANEDLAKVPHQKIIIIDGVIAFYGSTNLTLTGWRKTSDDLETLDVSTNLYQVYKLNNNYFSKFWRSTEHFSSRDVKFKTDTSDILETVFRMMADGYVSPGKKFLEMLASKEDIDPTGMDGSA